MTSPPDATADAAADADADAKLVQRDLLGARVHVAPAGTAPSIDGLHAVDLGPSITTLHIWTDHGPTAVIHGEGVAWYQIRDGREIVVHPEHGAHPERVAAMLHSNVPSMLLAQQGRFALHASTVQIGDRVVAISGRSGAGKSTTALALVQRGARPVVDDVTVLDHEHGQAVTRSFGRSTHAFPHVLDELGIDRSVARPIPGPRGKVALDWPESGATDVHHVIILRHRDVEEPSFLPLRGPEAVRALRRTTLLHSVLEPGHGSAMFHWHAAVATAVQVTLLLRPLAGWPVPDLCERIEALLGANST
jgi:hypothetical protein